MCKSEQEQLASTHGLNKLKADFYLFLIYCFIFNFKVMQK